MEQIVIIHEDGTTLPLFSKRNASTVSKATQKVALLNEDVVTITVQAATPLQLYIGDKVVVFGKRYRLNQLPEVTKEGERKYTYELKLEGAQYELLDIKYHLPETCYGDNYYSDLYGHLQILMWNINRVRPNEWVLGEYPENTEFKNINTDGKNCLAALQTLCSDYNVEFEMTYTGSVTTLNVKKKVGRTLPLTLQFGRGRGLYQLQRKNVNNTGIINRLFVYGGTGNLPQDYPHTKLCLLGTSRLTSYIEDNESIKKYGVKEGEKNYSEVEPEYKGTVTAVGEDLNTFTDSAMFDLNKKKDNGDTEWLIDGTPAKVKFQSGGLAGYEFDIHSYDHETRTFVINPFKDENGDVFPSAGAFQIEQGNEYIITEIRLPTSYITNAQKKLEEKGREDFATLVQPQVSYGLSISDSFMIAMFGREADTEVLHVGDSIPIVDEGVGVDKEVRITQLERNLLKPHSYTITLSDTVTRSTTLRVLNEIENINEVISINNLADPAKARRRWLAAQELLGMVFDTEGQYYSEKIKPLSIETTMLSVAAKSQQFVLSNVLMEANANGNPNSFTASNGFLTHYAIENDIVTWSLAGVSLTNLADNAMYIYAKCSKKTNEGTYYLTNVALKADADAAFYYFLIGTLSSAIADADGKRKARILSLTYGATTINGRFINTGRIQSANGGKAYFDLDNGEIGGSIKFISSDGKYKDVTDVEQQTAETKDYIENTLPDVLKDISVQLDGKIETWFQNTDPSESWDTDEERSAHVGDLWFNTDTKKAYCYSEQYSWGVIEDADAKKALEDASNAQDTADGKRRVFTSQPTTPYDKGDLWVQGATGGILVANTNRSVTETYNAADWVAASNYTGDENLNKFIDSVYTPAINSILKQLDGVIETWFGTGVPTLSNAPANDWATNADKEVHLGDIYYNNDDGTAYRFSKEGTAYKWVEISDSAIASAMQAAAAAQDTADGKRRVFVTQPTTPYDVGDLWTDGNDLYRCNNARATGSYVASDWGKATNYTDDSALEDFINNTYTDDIKDIEGVLDGKIECWYTTSDPANSWSSNEEKAKHEGDLWYNTSSKGLYYYAKKSSTVFEWTRVEDKTAIDAHAAAAAAQDTADGKRRVFLSTTENPTPQPPYEIGDLWVTGSRNGSIDGGLKKCVYTRLTGSYYANDWAVATCYDNTKTTIDGGIVTSGTVQLAGDDQSIKAGITGEGTADTSVRMWAGASKENKATAPFRVTQDGKMVASNADITGKVNATSGTFKGRVEAQEGVFYGSIATPPVELEDNLTPLTLDFSKGFNFTGTVSGGATKAKVINLPMSDEYVGVQCSIINYGGSSNGYYHIRAADTAYPLLYSGKLASRNNVTHLKLYGCAEVRLKAIKVMGVVRWFVQNPLEFSFDYIGSCFTNNLPSQLSRCVGVYRVDSATTLTKISCADNNPISMMRTAKGKYTFLFEKTRINSNYGVKLTPPHGIVTTKLELKNLVGFNVITSYHWFTMGTGGENFEDIAGWTIEIMEYDV